MLNKLKKLVNDKKEYKTMMRRVDALPEDYRYAYEKIQKYMWSYASGDGYDMLKIQYDLIDLFEDGAASGKKILDITGEDVASFADELMLNARTYTDKWRQKLNKEISGKLNE